MGAGRFQLVAKIMLSAAVVCGIVGTLGPTWIVHADPLAIQSPHFEAMAMFFPIPFVFLSATVCALIDKRRAWRWMVGMPVAFAVNCCGATVWSGGVRGQAIAETQLDGERIAEALTRYEVSYGGYPDDLEDLVPAYLQRVPPVPFHQTSGFVQYPANWRYSICGDEGDTHFHLQFSYPGPCNRTLERDGSWRGSCY